MKTIPCGSSAEVVLALIDDWIRLLEKEDYLGASEMIGNNEDVGMKAEVLQELVKEFGQMPRQRVTFSPPRTPTSDLHGVRFNKIPDEDIVGDADYRINFDGARSDRWAEFFIHQRGESWHLEFAGFNS